MRTGCAPPKALSCRFIECTSLNSHPAARPTSRLPTQFHARCFSFTVGVAFAMPRALHLGSALLAFAAAATAQQQFPSPLDPARDPASLSAPAQAPLPEEYIWTAGDVTALHPDRARF